MNWISNEQKNSLVDLGVNLFVDEINHNKRIRESKFDNRIDPNRIKELENQLNNYELWFNNFVNADLDCKFKKTENIFKEIVFRLMDDETHDYFEIVFNFINHLDNENFINNHTKAVYKRERRLDDEYNIALNDYRTRLNEYKSKNFFSKIFTSEPTKPIRRE